jgi:beta-phosphoglucomutase-like phosphatase (HAD superfamily)
LAEAAALPENWVWRDGPVAPRPAAVFDLDGVLSDAAGRQHFLLGPGRKDWKSFFDHVGSDPLVEDVNRLLELLDESLAIVLLSARPARVRAATVAWLERYGIRWDLLVMRPDGAQDSAVDFKRTVVELLQKVGFDLRIAFEDDRRNVEMFRAAGIPCVYIHSGYYE